MERSITPLTQYNQFRVEDTIVQLDKLCKKCFKGDTMLCSGMRIYVNQELTDKYGYLNVTTGPCSKLRDKLNTDATERAILMSGIPKSFVEKDEVIDYYFPKPFMYEEFSDSLRQQLWSFGLDNIRNGLSFKYVLVQLLLKKFSEWDSLIDQLGDRYKILVLDRYDLGNAPDMACELLAELVRYRYSNDLSTIVTVGKNPRPRCTAEMTLYELMEMW